MTNLSNQQFRLILALRRRPLTTLQIRQQLCIADPATRVFELKNEHGINIETEMVAVSNRFGEKCRVARYHLRDRRVRAAALLRAA